ncbi:putative receptor-like serine/threonine-protein kinase [Senna tora]|uniref:Putative receptor-like serine/threonine-protein kinase n=1 Tax=Senna tora TaxID=362788 RepID=A0A834WX59_9FABA|nr:putative receptor-like serine/threonine-protein kinase [Senna tora]
MELIGRREKLNGDTGDGGRTVLVGVKSDFSRSRELLKWALDKIAEPGDLVIAIHVLDSKNTALIPSLVKAFDFILAEYEDYCNLKQIDLKFKVRIGAPARKLLVQEAKSLGASTVLAGTSNARFTIRSSASVIEYCARKLPKCISVFAVDKGKIVFQRDAINHQVKLNEGPILSQNSISVLTKENLKNYMCCARVKTLLENSATNPTVGLPDDVSSSSIMVQESNQSSYDCSPLSKKNLKKSFVTNAYVFKRAFQKPKRHFSRLVHPDHKQSTIDHNDDHIHIPKELLGLQDRCTLYSFQELASATSNFAPENLIGRGGSSLVYKGCLPEGKELAVKILSPSQDALKEFVLEVKTLTTLHHKNIISLSGFCLENDNLLLAYDFLSRGSLKDNIHGKKDCGAFNWNERYKVAVGIAEALDYLHNGCAQTVIHRDVKSANILLSDDFDPQLSDFGLTSLNSPSHVICTDVVGTFGYLAPEYLMHGTMTEKIDVYAFGVVLLELLSSRMPIKTKNQESLATPILKCGKISQLLDPSLGSDYDPSQIERMILKLLCGGDEEVTRWAKQEVSAPEELNVLDGEPVRIDNIQSKSPTPVCSCCDDSNKRAAGP